MSEVSGSIPDGRTNKRSSDERRRASRVWVFNPTGFHFLGCYGSPLRLELLGMMVSYHKFRSKSPGPGNACSICREGRIHANHPLRTEDAPETKARLRIEGEAPWFYSCPNCDREIMHTGLCAVCKTLGVEKNGARQREKPYPG